MQIQIYIFEAEGITPASEALRRQGVLLNNLTGQNAAQGIDVQVLINNETKPLGSDNYVYVDNDTQWDSRLFIAKSITRILNR